MFCNCPLEELQCLTNLDADQEEPGMNQKSEPPRGPYYDYDLHASHASPIFNFFVISSMTPSTPHLASEILQSREW